MKRTLGLAPIEVANCHIRRARTALWRGVFIGFALGMVTLAIIIDMVGG